MEFLRDSRQKRRERIKKLYERHKRIHELFKRHASDILASENFRGTRRHIQHGSMTVYSHCMNVARYSLLLNKKLGLKCDKHDLIRGALLHDYFLYDWHDKYHRDIKRLHGFYHPGIALRNASREYNLTEREKDIIKKHMWPLTVIPPRCREAWIVTTADKYCSLLETMKFHREHRRYIANKKSGRSFHKEGMTVQCQG